MILRLISRPRVANLPVFGPDGNDHMPSTTAFLNTLLGNQGVYRHLSDYIEADEPPQGAAQEVATRTEIGKSYEGPVLSANDLDIIDIE
ncbi:MAG: hypothetical protein ACI8QT_001863 [Halioglobus sp.]